MIARPRAFQPATPRLLFERRRAQAVAAVALIALGLATVGWLLVAPRELAAVRVFGVSLAWWAVFAAQALGLGVLATGPRGPRDRPGP